MLQQISFHILTPSAIAVCHSTKNSRSDSWSGCLHTCVVVISTEIESGFIPEDHMSEVGHPVNSIYNVRIEVNVLMHVGSLHPVTFERFLLVSSDLWNVVCGVKPILEAFLMQIYYSNYCAIIDFFVFLKRPDPLSMVDSIFQISMLPTPKSLRSGDGRYVCSTILLF